MTRIVRTILLHEFDDGTWDVSATRNTPPGTITREQRSQYLTASQAYEQVSDMMEPEDVKGP